MSEFLSRLRFFFRRKPPAELDEELQFHLEQATQANIAAGMTPEEARRQARIDFGGIESAREETHAQRPGWWMQTVLQDIRHALRGFRRNPIFTLTAVITLGLGIGATTAIFSAVYSLLLHPLPYRDSNRLMWVSNEWPKLHMEKVLSPNFVAARKETKSFEQLAAFTYGDGILTGAGGPIRVTHASVTANFLPMLGVKVQMGRTFSASEDRSGGSNVALISNRLWRNQFDANPHIVGSSLLLDGVDQTVIGVLPPHFWFPDVQFEPDVYSPLGLDPAASVTDKQVSFLSVIGRLRVDVSAQRAEAEMLALFLARTKTYPAGFGHMAQGQQAVVEPLQRHLTGDARTPLVILLVSVLAVLLISCANVANLQLARAVSRQHETALRGALGASRWRLVRQFLVESLILSSLAAALGFTIAFIATWLIRHGGTLDGSQPSSHIAQVLRLPFGKLNAVIQVDGWVLAFTVSLSLLTTLLFGLAPALSVTRTDLRNALQAAALHISSGREQRLLRHSLLVFEIGLAVVLLASSGLLVRSFVNVLRYDSGFDPSHTLTGVTVLNGQRYASGERMRHFVDQLLRRLQALPGVEAAAVTSVLPIQPYDFSSTITFEGQPAAPAGLRPSVPVVSVTPDYFRVVGTPIFQGRAFNSSDSARSVPVTIVNRAFANRFFAGDAVGKRFHTMALASEHPAVTIVGIADDVRHGRLEQEAQPEMYCPMAQLPQATVNIALRTANSPALLAAALRNAVTAVDREQPLFDVQTMEERVSEAVAQRRLIMLLIACFALLAVVLSTVGVYGVFAYSTTQRSQEMGIRLALGSSRGGILQLVLIQAARLIALGGILGVITALALSRLLTSLLVGVTPHDTVSFSLAWGLMTVVALAATLIPARSAMNVDPMIALRHE
jgi:predicted permease